MHGSQQTAIFQISSVYEPLPELNTPYQLGGKAFTIELVAMLRGFVPCRLRLVSRVHHKILNTGGRYLDFSRIIDSICRGR